MTRWSKASLEQLEGYLEAVAAVLREGGSGEEEIKAVVADLRDHALKAAETQRSGTSSEDAAMDAVLAQLDDPGAFREVPVAASRVIERRGDPAATTGAPAPHASGALERALATASAVLAPTSAVAGSVLGMLGKGTFEDLGGTVYVAGEVLALVAGFVARRTALGRFGMIAAIALLAVLLAAVAFGL